MRSVEWSTEALLDFRTAIDFISQRSEGAAETVALRILQAIDHLADLPTGRPGRVSGTYEKLVQRTSYIIAYTMSDRTIFVLRVIHASRDWPDGEWPPQ